MLMKTFNTKRRKIMYLPERVDEEQALTTLLWQTSSVLTTAQIAAKTATTIKAFIFVFVLILF